MHLTVWVELVLTVSLVTNLAQGSEERLCFSRATIQHLFDELASLSRQCHRPAWPMAKPTYQISVVTHRVSLALNPVVIPDKKWTNWSKQTMQNLANKYRGKRPKGSWLRRMVTMQRSLGYRKTRKNEYDYYPPMVNVKGLVKMMERGKPLPMAPVDDPNVHAVRLPHTCSLIDHRKYDLILVVYSCVKCAGERHSARKTFLKQNLWKPLNIGYFFVMGMPADVNRRVFKFHDIRIRQIASYGRGDNKKKATKALLKEADTHKDLLIGDYQDEFFHSTLRSIIAFRWASLFCSQRTPLFLFLDPYYAVVPYQVKNLVRRIAKKSRPHYYAGPVLYRSPVLKVPSGRITNNRWGVSNDELPWKYYPHYVSRLVLLAGSQTVRDATLAMMYTRRFRITDVYLGIVFYRIKRKPKNLRNFRFSVNKKSVKFAMGGFRWSIVKRVNWSTGKAK